MNVYELINSKAVGKYCEEIKHKFNIEEVAVLIFRNKKMSIEEKINAYNELIETYEDMPMQEHLHGGPYDSVKEVIRKERKRLKELVIELEKEDENYFYKYIPYYISANTYSGNDSNIRKTYKEVLKEAQEEINEDDDISTLMIEKKEYTSYNHVTAYFSIKDKEIIMYNIYDNKDDFRDFGTIFLNIPTPFKKGDLLVSCVNTPFGQANLQRNENVFVLDWLITWKEDLEKRMKEALSIDDTDMGGYGYYIYEKNIVRDHAFDYDCWEYYEGKLEGIFRILKGVENLIKGKIDLECFLKAYEEMKKESNDLINRYVEDYIKLTGFTNEDIKKMEEK